MRQRLENQRLSDHFMIVPPRFWNDDLVLISEYLTLSNEEAYSKVPFIWMVDKDNILQKVATTWSVMIVCQERLDFWHYIQENCGVKSYHVEKAIEKTKEEIGENAAREIESLKAEHEKEIEAVREKTAGEAMERLSEILLDIDTLSIELKPSTTTTSAPPIEKPPVAQESMPVEEQEEEADEEETLSLGEPWLESVLCTTCNECTDINNKLFKYNGDKQAYIADPKAGTFAEIVEAAEKCPTKLIHPGAPLNPNENGLEELIKRAEPFN